MAILFFAELFLLFFLSRSLTSELSKLFHSVFRSQKVSVFLMALVFLPGTIIHELSHALMAKLLFVHVGKMEFMPQLSDGSLKLGSVEVGQTDIVRNLLIGIAPFLVGGGLLLGVLYYIFSNQILGLNLITFLTLLFAFIISNTMYSSKKDMEGAVGFLFLIGVFIALFYFLGIRIPGFSWEIVSNNGFTNYFQTGSVLLGIPIVIDIAIILFAKILTRS